ncbi:hypothetical protein LXL04_025655 [Taraxacum kok-saghyz]
MRRHIKNEGRNRGYECKTCKKRFDTFQALGGHQGSHRKVRPVDNVVVCELSLQIASDSTSGVLQLHKCTMCTKKFDTGQALGGHMRRHKREKDLISMNRKLVRQRLVAEEKVESELVVDDVKVRQQTAEEDERSEAKSELVLAAKTLSADFEPIREHIT